MDDPAPRKKILVLSDHPLVPSGVGIQTRYLIEGLLRTEKYKFVCLGGAIKHPDKRIQHVDPKSFGEGNWIIYPVDGHGNKDVLRGFLYRERPDAVLMVTDPRFFVWVWEMEDEIRSVCPLVYWHVWDNDPSPDFNRVFYDSTDAVGCISLKTFGILQDLKYENRAYIPHALPQDVFRPLPMDEVLSFKSENYGPHGDKNFILMWNNRNARRKQTGDVIATFSKFANKVGKKNVALFMHTSVGDQEGQNVIALAKKFDVEKELIISEQRVQADVINKYYNAADVTINIASNEGFGLSSLESIFTGTPVINHMTGGLQYQMGDWYKHIKNFDNQDKLTACAKKAWQNKSALWCGVPVFPASRSCTGSQQIPYIYDDRVCHEDVVQALLKLYEMGPKRRREIGLKARDWAIKEFDLKKMVSNWDDLIDETITNFEKTTFRSATL